MNLKKTLSNPKSKKIIFVILIFIAIFLAIILINLNTKETPQQIPTTVPLITQKKIEPTPTLNTTNPFNPKQKLTFNWGNISPEIPDSINKYSIETPLVNPSTINLAASKFGFTVLEKSQNTDQDSSVWLNEKASLFGSPRQNQIFFNSVEPIPPHLKTYTRDEAIEVARNIITNTFGSYLFTTLGTNPEVRFLSLIPETEDEPKDVSPDTSNIINVNFTQTIDQLPLLNLSKKGETISVAIDTHGKTYLLYVHGGYINLSNTGQVNIFSYDQLKLIAPSDAMRISQVQNIDTERIYSDAKNVRINVTRVGLGYYQRADNDIFPVFIIEGDLETTGVPTFPATFIVPATVQ